VDYGIKERGRQMLHTEEKFGGKSSLISVLERMKNIKSCVGSHDPPVNQLITLKLFGFLTVMADCGITEEQLGVLVITKVMNNFGNIYQLMIKVCLLIIFDFDFNTQYYDYIIDNL